MKQGKLHSGGLIPAVAGTLQWFAKQHKKHILLKLFSSELFSCFIKLTFLITGIFPLVMVVLSRVNAARYHHYKQLQVI